MSNTPTKFKRKKKEPVEPLPFEIDDELFLFQPEMGSKALEAIGRLEKDGTGAMFEAISALMVERPDVKAEVADGEKRPPEKEGSSFRRFVDLDLDAKTELPPVFELIFGLYGDASPGESAASSTSSGDDEANSSPTSEGSTPASTSKRLKSA